MNFVPSARRQFLQKLYSGLLEVRVGLRVSALGISGWTGTHGEPDGGGSGGVGQPVHELPELSSQGDTPRVGSVSWQVLLPF